MRALELVVINQNMRNARMRAALYESEELRYKEQMEKAREAKLEALRDIEQLEKEMGELDGDV